MCYYFFYWKWSSQPRESPICNHPKHNASFEYTTETLLTESRLKQWSSSNIDCFLMNASRLKTNRLSNRKSSNATKSESHRLSTRSQRPPARSPVKHSFVKQQSLLWICLVLSLLVCSRFGSKKRIWSHKMWLTVIEMECGSYYLLIICCVHSILFIYIDIVFFKCLNRKF